MSSLASKSVVLLGSCLMMAGAAYSDDTEIFFQAGTAGVIRPNVLFVVDTSGSMSYGQSFVEDGSYNTSTTGVSTKDRRIQIVKDVMEQILMETSGVNAGIMRYNRGGGGNMVYPVANLESTGAEDERGHGAVPGRKILRSRVVIKDGADDGYEANNGSGQNLTDNSIRLKKGYRTGLRFQGVDVPRKAKITRAYVDFNVIGGTQTGGLGVIIRGHKSADSPVFSSTNKLKTLWESEATTASSTWSIGSSWQGKESYRTTDLSSVVQEIVNQSTWCGGNALSLMFMHDGIDDESRQMVSYENPYTVNSYYTPVPSTLVVEYDEAQTIADTAASGTCFRGSTAEQVAAAEDDVEEVSSVGTILRNDVDIDVFQDPVSNQTNAAVGFRFRGVNVPQGATITTASLLLTANNNGSVASSGSVYGVAADSASSFATSVNALTNSAVTPLTSGSTFSLPTTTNKDTTYSFSIKDQVQAIVDRGGWAPGNNMAFILKATVGNFQSYAYESSAGNAARIAINYKIDGNPFSAGQVTKRQMMVAELRQLLSDGGTPTAAAFYESYLYFAGKNVDYGANRASNPTSRGAHPLVYTGGGYNLPTNCPGYDSNSAQCGGEGATGSNTYISPVTDACQKNVIVILSDGQPNTATGLAAKIKANTSPQVTCTNSQGGEDCSYKLAEHLSGSSVDLSSSIIGNQNAQVYTIGFGLGTSTETNAYKYLDTLASKGGGKFYNAQNAADLIKAFNSITSSLKDINSTFVSAGVTVNQFNRLTHLDQLYFALFKPTTSPTWYGNLKRFRLKASDGNVYDYNGNAALNSATGQFENTSRSWWSSVADGNDVRKGGAASVMTNARVVYTNWSGTDLTATDNRVWDANTAIDANFLGAANGTERTKILNWAVGQDVNNATNPTAARKTMGDPLHSQPVLISYDVSGSSINRVVMGANDGFLHFIDPETGAEQWSFIPKELLPKLKTFQTGTAFGPHPYGLDGPITVHLYKDDDKDGVVDVGTDKAYLYVGMRRGGRSYYALDISNPTTPAFLFKITGGLGASDDYNELGYTWSRMLPTKIKMPLERNVLVFGGGYDPNQDSSGGSSDDSMGRTVFIADAQTGARLWSARVHSGQQTGALADPTSLMSYSIPSDVAGLDYTGSGYLEHIYVGDMGGQVFRFDVQNGAASSSALVKGGRFANIQDSSMEVDNRRFYYAPDLTRNDRPGGYGHLAVSIGSGFREHPLDTAIEEHFYSFRDYGLVKSSPQFDSVIGDIELDKLININDFNGDQKTVSETTGAVTAGADGVGDAIQALENEAALAPAASAKRGWYLPFNGQNTSIRKSGEKVLSQAVTVNGTIFFTAYYPTAGSSSCEPSEGKSRLYALKLTGGDTTKFYPDIETLTATSINQGDRFVDLKTPGIVPGALILSTGEGLRLLAGAENPGLNDLLNPGGGRLKIQKWRQRDSN